MSSIPKLRKERPFLAVGTPGASRAEACRELLPFKGHLAPGASSFRELSQLGKKPPRLFFPSCFFLPSPVDDAMPLAGCPRHARCHLCREHSPGNGMGWDGMGAMAAPQDMGLGESKELGEWGSSRKECG